MGPITPSRKKLSITETGNSKKQFYMGNSTTTCLTPNDNFITWEDGLITAEKERTALGFDSWSEATVAARDRVTWRRRVFGPIPT